MKGLLTAVVLSLYLVGCLEQPKEGEESSPSSNEAVLNFDGANPHDFGNTGVGSQSALSVTVSNSGATSALSLSETGLSAPFSFNGGSYPGASGTCGSVLSSGASCTLDIRYSPASTGAHSGALTLEYNNGAATTSVTKGLSGTGVNLAYLTLSPSGPYDFGSVSTSSSSSLIVTVSNIGPGNANSVSGAGLAGAFSFTGGSYPGTSGTCSTAIASGLNCTVEIQFAPVVTGADSDTMEINYNDGASSQSVTMDVSGTGI